MYRLVAVVAVVFVATSASLAPTLAQSFWMNEARLRAVFAGAAIDGHYIDKRTFREQYDAGGTLDYVEHASGTRFTGDWSVTADRFCTIYHTSGSGGCFRVRQTSANCFEFYFDTRTEEEARSSTLREPTWTARAWLVDQVSTCEERPLV